MRQDSMHRAFHGIDAYSAPFPGQSLSMRSEEGSDMERSGQHTALQISCIWLVPRLHVRAEICDWPSECGG